jgi:hypothetical protein
VILKFIMARMLLAPEGAPAGGSGGGAPAGGGGAAPAGGVSGPASPAGGGTPFPHILGGGEKPAAPSGAAPGGGGGEADDDLETAIREDAEGRGIPHDRVRTMRSGWEKKASELALQQARQQFMADFGPLLEELQAFREKASQMDPANVKAGVVEGILRGLGVQLPGDKKAEPKFVSVEDFQRGIRDVQSKFERETEQRQELEAAQRTLSEVRGKHAELFEDFPVIEEFAAAVWGSPWAVEKKISYGAILEGIVKSLKGGLDKASKRYVEGKEKDLRQEIPIVPGSGPKPGAKKPGKVDHSPEATANRAVEFLKNAGRATG